MKLGISFLFLAFAFSSEALPTDREPEIFASNYYARGILRMPFADINEPFEAYYDKLGRRSRIDFYGDTVKTYQLENKGESYKLAFTPDENGTPRRTCFKEEGSSVFPITIQSILPNLTGYEYVKDENCFADNDPIKEESKHTTCELWQFLTEAKGKRSTYIMYIHKKSKAPVRYIIKGFNTVLGSKLYDIYELYYLNYTVDSARDEHFVVEKDLVCRSVLSPFSQKMAFMNPMREHINNDDNHIHEKFEDFKNRHKKLYEHDEEHESRKNIFRQNHRYIDSMNRAGLTFSLKINRFADFTDTELSSMSGLLSSTNYSSGRTFPYDEFKKAPKMMDWRLRGAVTPVKDQALCGSCWSFGTTGTIEGTYFLKNKSLVRLSQQQLIDCSWRYQNHGCDGGLDHKAYDYIMSAGGLASEDDYGHYMAQDGICHDSNVTKTARITGFVKVPKGNVEALKQAIAEKGPISVSIHASLKSFFFYSHGIYYDPDCGGEYYELDHSVVAVGYGIKNGEPYWILKNSWSPFWGMDGYMRISQKNNNCGVTTKPTYVLM